MNTKQEKLDAFAELIGFAESLERLSEEQWSGPIAEGKWSPRDIISHIMLWDKYFLEHAVRPMAEHQPLTLKNLDFNEFNRNAADYGLTQSQPFLIGETVKARRQLLELMQSIPETEYSHKHGGIMSIDEYLVDFYEHDRHHMAQINTYIAGLS
ncbi:DinB family protein [Paenibacillus dokdonensis]|uniref:DinB family protein n=1 Tax=Paenibacillus dokdonensis TaxID=2567944 RepID=A0ABU6GGQ2_9BACL|nr:DinB family protein [Paenibacillus dokdonensis]MEC0238921.1 DinB family protein [Paenibacillus dokdonensis]